MSAEWTQVEVIDLINDGTGLGFGIIGGKSTGVVIKTILPGGIAERVSVEEVEMGGKEREKVGRDRGRNAWHGHRYFTSWRYC